MPERKRHTKGRTKRGPAGRDRQLGHVQRSVLVWLLTETRRIIGEALEADEIETGKLRDVVRTPEESEAWCERARNARRRLDTRGVPWEKVSDKLGLRSSAVSEALAALETSARKLVHVTRSPAGRASHVKLSSLGERVATELKVEAENIPGRMQAAYELRHGPRPGWTRALEIKFQRSLREIVAERETPAYDLPPIRVSVLALDPGTGTTKVASVLDGTSHWTGKDMSAEERKLLEGWLRAARKYYRNKPEE